MQIEVEVKGQRIKRINSPGSVEDTLNYLTCHFTFDGAEWENTVKTAYFQNPASGEKYPKILADDGTCTVPWEALTDKGFVRFSVAGERDGYRITTGIESFYNSETVYGGEPSEPPTPSQYDQMIALAERTKEIAESVRRDADEGKFDGDPGEPGKPGAPGRDGVSPTAKVEQTDDGAVITITDAAGTTAAELKNGKEGNPGQNATDEQVQAAVDAYMEEHPIQGDTEDIIKLAIKNEASGAVPISIMDSAEMGVQDIKMQGWTEQKSTEGNQLFDKSGIVLSGTTITYTPVNVGDGEYTLSTDYIASGRNDIFFLPGNVNTGASSLSNGVEHGTSRTVTSENGYVTVALRLGSDGTTSPLNYQIMLNSGSTALTYEPYTGGAPSPNPDYPQEIVSAGKYDEGTGKYEYEVKLTGANLFDISKVITNSGLLTNNGDGTLTATPGSGDSAVSGKAPRTLRDYCPELISGKTYRLSANSTGITKQIYLLGANNIWAYGRPRTITDADLESEVFFYASGVNTEAVISDIMITEVEDADYEPYRTPQTVTLTSDRPLTKWDKLEKRDGQWGWVYKSNHLNLTGTENFVLYETTENINKFVLYNIPTEIVLNYNTNSGYSNTFLYDPDVLSSEENGTYRIYTSVSTRWLAISIDKSYTLDIFKDFLQEKYEEGNPLIFWYETAEETFVPLSESEQEALNALHTYYPTTMLSNDAGCEMTIKYIADTKAYIDSKIAAIQAAVVNRI